MKGLRIGIIPYPASFSLKPASLWAGKQFPVYTPFLLVQKPSAKKPNDLKQLNEERYKSRYFGPGAAKCGQNPDNPEGR